MPMADARLVAVRQVLAVLDGRSLDAALSQSTGVSDDRDRALAAELSYGVCRWYRRLDALLQQLLAKPLKARDRDLHVLMLVGAYQLLYSRVPEHAALSATVEGARGLGKPWASKLVNGVLRRLQRERTRLEAHVDAIPAQRYALPDWLFDAIEQAWPGRGEAIAAALQQRPPMTLRVDLAQVTRTAYAAELGASGIAARPHPWVGTALVLDRAVSVDRLPGFSRARVSVQDAGAQLAAPLLDPSPGQRVLDACAAPGGKTLHLLQHQSAQQLFAADVDATRLQRVGENLARAGVEAELQVADVAKLTDLAWASGGFDRILLDAPCSATGVLRRHPDIRLLRRADDIDDLVARQGELLDAAWACLRPGGRLLYVTCSMLPRENAAQIDHFLQRHPAAVAAELALAHGTRSGIGVQLLPDRDNSDGFFYAAVDKPSDYRP
jgi:16S rRNA (cytosine967-C5)-methyltransferase